MFKKLNLINNKSILSFLIFLFPIWIISINNQRYYVGLIFSSLLIIYLFFFGDFNIKKLFRSKNFNITFICLLILITSLIGAANIFNIEKTIIYSIRICLPFFLIYVIMYSENINLNAKHYLQIYIYSLIFYSSIELINAVKFTIFDFEYDFSQTAHFTELYYDIKKIAIFSSDSNWWSIVLFPCLIILWERLNNKMNFFNIIIFLILFFYLILTFSKTTIAIVLIYFVTDLISFILSKGDRKLFSLSISVLFFFSFLFFAVLYPFDNTRFNILNSCFEFYNYSEISGIIFGIGTDGFPKQYYHNAHVLCGAFVEYGIFYIILLISYIYLIISENNIKIFFWLFVIFSFSLFPVAQLAHVFFPLILLNKISYVR